MPEKKLIHKTHVILEGETYQVLVYSCQYGRHYAETSLDDDDIIISDAGSLEEVLQKHVCLLPLAISAREIRAKAGRSPRSKSR